ncbi:MAG: universal stress protein [Bacteroidota bacterium]
MDILKRILVGIDLSEIDVTLIRYTDLLVSAFDVDTVYFIHVAKSLEIPDELLEKYPDLIPPLDETIEKQIESLVDQYLENKDKVKVKTIVKEGNAEDKILRWSDIKEIDLMVLGRKHNLKGSGRLPGQLTRVGHCSVLMVPEFVEPKIDRIMVPVDFSKNSSIILVESMKIKDCFKAKLIIQHTYRVPIGYHASGKSYEEFQEIMKEHAFKDADKFLSKNGIDKDLVEVVVTEDDNDEPADRIYEEANSRKVNLVVIASRGRTGLASMLLGSVADKLCQYDTTIPLLIIKNKKENMGFLEALWRI